MTPATRAPFAAAGLLLAAGACTVALGAEAPPTAPPPQPAVASTPAPQAAAVPTVVTSILPLSVFELNAGQQVTIGDTALIADSDGLTLPLGKPVEVSWQKDGAQFRYRVISIDASTGPMVPAWVTADPTVQADGSVIAVGRGYGRSVAMAVAKALMDARREASTTGLGQTTTDVTVQADGSGNQRAESVHSTFNGSVSSQTTDQVITVCADPAHAPAIPLKPGTEQRLSARPGINPVRCWVRISAQVKPPTEAERRTREPEKAAADKAVGDLDALIDKDMHGKQTPAPK